MAKFNIKTVKPKFVVTTAPETKIDVSINRPIITAKNQKAYFKLKNTGGPKGEKGDTGVAATITVGSTSTGAPGTNASVTNSGTSSAAVLNFTIPRGDKGDKGDTGATGNPGAAATISVGTTTTGQPGTNASVTNVGTSSAAVLNFTIPKGAKGDTGATGAPGATGSPGAAATVSVGTTTTGQPGTNASVTNSGTQSAAVLNFTIPKGAKGDNGNPGSAATIAVGTVTTGLPGTSATVTNVGTSSAAVFDFTIPRGDKGEAGSGSGDMLASDYDPNGTVANAGGIVDYVTAHEPTKTSDLVNDGSDGSAVYLETDETAYKTASIPYGACDPSSTNTAYTATVPGVTELRDGVCMWLKNGVVTSVAGFTIDINGLGAKPVYNNMAAAGRETTLWNVNYTMFFVYDSTRVEGGCWMLYRGYNSDNNTIGYQLRTNSYSLPMTSIVYRYRLLFTSADGEHFVPSNNSTSTNATASRTVCQDPIDPFGNIVYYGATASVAAGSRPSATALWSQYTISLGYSFNRTGAALVLTLWKPVYIKCAPQSDGSAIIDSTTPYVQDLPSTEDGKIYIFLGVAYTTANIELLQNHPVYYYKDGQIRLWTNAAATGGGGPTVVQTTGQSTTDVMSQKAVTDELALKADASSLATVATSGSYNDLSNKPTIPAAQVNSDWSANSGVAQILNKPTLATVATSGSYNDLSNKPTIPTVNNATLTIQKNGANVQTFTANQSTNATANITVPTKTSDLTNNGADNTSTYVEADELAPIATDGMAVLAYGTSTWQDFIDAYNENRVVYCRASLNADPSVGDKTRLAPLIYVDSESSPTSAQFHFHRSFASHTDARQVDQVIVYTLDSANGGTWSVETREEGTRVVAGANMTSWYNSGVLTLNSAQPAPVDHTADVTTGTNVTIDAGGKVISIGKIVIVNMNIVTSATVYAYSMLLSSIPMRNPDNFLWLSMVDANNANKMYRVYYQSGSGEIRTRDQLPAGTYGLSFVYVTS